MECNLCLVIPAYTNQYNSWNFQSVGQISETKDCLRSIYGKLGRNSFSKIFANVTPFSASLVTQLPSADLSGDSHSAGLFSLLLVALYREKSDDAVRDKPRKKLCNSCPCWSLRVSWSDRLALASCFVGLEASEPAIVLSTSVLLGPAVICYVMCYFLGDSQYMTMGRVLRSLFRRISTGLCLLHLWFSSDCWFANEHLCIYFRKINQFAHFAASFLLILLFVGGTLRSLSVPAARFW